MSDIDTLLRERLGAAAAFDVATDPRHVRETIARRQRQIRRRRRTAGLLGVLATVAATLGIALMVRNDPPRRDVVAPTVEDPTTACGTPPRFRPAPGWEVTQGPSSTTAANVALGPSTASGDAPWDTVDRLTDGEVLLYAMTYPASEVTIDDQSLFPERHLPLALDDAEPGGLEGQPDDVSAERFTSRVEGWLIDIVVFYGNDPFAHPRPTDPSARARDAAQEQLALLEVLPDCRHAP